MIGYLALAHNDRLFIYSFTDTLKQRIGPISGKGQIPTLLNYLSSTIFDGFSDLQATIKRFIDLSPRNGLVIIMSDFLDIGPIQEAIQMLPSPSWDVIVINILHPNEITPDIHGIFEMIDVETGGEANYDIDEEICSSYNQKIQEWLQQVADICDENNAFHILMTSNWSIEKDVIPLMLSTHIVRPL